MLDASLKRTITFTNAIEDLDAATNALLAAAQPVLAAEHAGDESLGADLHALHQLAMTARARLTERARQCAEQHGWQVATYLIADDTRKGGAGADPIVWLTGNAMMPPMRAYANSEDIWQLGDYEVWDAYVGGIERGCDEQSIMLAVPEYDNSHYAVDLKRWEYVDDPDEAESLGDEWRLREDA
jgi:hypothetical protein